MGPDFDKALTTKGVRANILLLHSSFQIDNESSKQLILLSSASAVSNAERHDERTKNELNRYLTR